MSLTVLATVLPFTTLAIMPLAVMLGAGAIAAILVTSIAMARRMVAASSIGVLLVTVLLLEAIGVGSRRVQFGLAFIVYGVVIWRVSWLRKGVTWCRAGLWDTRLAAVAVAFGLVSASTLWVLHQAWPGELDDVTVLVPAWPMSVIGPAAVLAAVMNAALEEAVYRGVLQDSLERVLRPGVTALTLQAAAFAAVHSLVGVPWGLAGPGLFAYGIVMGILRRRSGGLAIPTLAHAITDLAIVGVVLARAAP